MPNWVTNYLQIKKGDPQQVWDAIRGEEDAFDYNRLIPQPSDLYREPVSAEDIEKNPHNWYTWNNENWGVKWNASDVRQEGDHIRWESPWGPPLPVMVKLFQMFPEHELFYEWEEEQGFGQKIDVANGMVIITPFYFDFEKEVSHEEPTINATLPDWAEGRPVPELL
jgi:hypothetical protein